MPNFFFLSSLVLGYFIIQVNKISLSNRAGMMEPTDIDHMITCNILSSRIFRGLVCFLLNLIISALLLFDSKSYHRAFSNWILQSPTFSNSFDVCDHIPNSINHVQSIFITLSMIIIRGTLSNGLPDNQLAHI